MSPKTNEHELPQTEVKELPEFDFTDLVPYNAWESEFSDFIYDDGEDELFLFI